MNEPTFTRTFCSLAEAHQEGFKPFTFIRYRACSIFSTDGTGAIARVTVTPEECASYYEKVMNSTGYRYRSPILLPGHVVARGNRWIEWEVGPQ